MRRQGIPCWSRDVTRVPIIRLVLFGKSAAAVYVRELTNRRHFVITEFLQHLSLSNEGRGCNTAGNEHDIRDIGVLSSNQSRQTRRFLTCETTRTKKSKNDLGSSAPHREGAPTRTDTIMETEGITEPPAVLQRESLYSVQFRTMHHFRDKL